MRMFKRVFHFDNLSNKYRCGNLKLTCFFLFSVNVPFKVWEGGFHKHSEGSVHPVM